MSALTQSGHAPAGVVELGDRELARANLVLRFSAVRSRQRNEKPDLDVSLLRLQQLMRNGDAASAAPALTAVSRRRREIDPDLVIFLVIASSAGFHIVAFTICGFPG